MVRWLRVLIGTLRSTVRTHRELALENLALRQQLAVWKARQPRPRLTAMDRMFWVALPRLWKGWRNSLQAVRPETVVGWHAQGVRAYSAWTRPRRRRRPAPAGAFQCHGTSDLGLDWAATDRGVRAGGGPTASDPGPRPGLWRTIFASGQDVGHPGSGHCATLALAKRLCRARDWIDATGMP